MATSKRCSKCQKEAGSILCTGCNEYFCWKDIKIHREALSTEMETIVEERNCLQTEINKVLSIDDQHNPVFQKINRWQDTMIEKVKQAANQTRQQVIQLLVSKRTQINTEFKTFSDELARLQENENFVEGDLAQLKQRINQFKQDVEQSMQPTKIELCTEQSDGINWYGMIYVVDKQSAVTKQKHEASKLITSLFHESYA